MVANPGSPTVRAVIASVALLVLVLATSTWAAAPCVLDRHDGGDVVVRESGGGSCQWPRRTTTVRGTLTFPEAINVEFVGAAAVKARAIVIEAGASLHGEARTLQKLTLTATGGENSDIRSEGVLDLEASNDIFFVARRSIALEGRTHLSAGDRVLLRAQVRDVTISPPEFTPHSFTLFGRNRVDLVASGAQGSIDLGGARVGGFRIILTTRAYVSVVSQKLLRLNHGTVLTTNRTATGLPDQSNIQLDATGPIVITGHATLDAGTNITVRTQRLNDDVCLSNDVTLEANDGLGRIFFSAVHGNVFDDGTTIFRGLLLGADKIVVGTCGEPPTTTPTSTTTSTSVRRPTTTSVRGSTTTTTTLTPGEDLQSAQWTFYVRIARTDGSEVNVTVPKRSTDAPVTASIRADHISAFALGDQLTQAEIEALGGDTLARLTDAAQTYLAAHAADYPGFDRVVQLLWAKRVS
jgi:hypothetical protein